MFESERVTEENLPFVLKTEIERWDPTIEVSNIYVITSADSNSAEVNMSITSIDTGETFDYDLAIDY